MLKDRLRPLLPASIVGALRKGRKDVRRLRYRLRGRADSTTVGREEIAAALGEVGLGTGDGVFVHTAMSSFGRIEGGPPTVVAAFDDVLGPEGLIAMPAFPLLGGTVEYLSGDPVFDVRATPSTMGAVTEYFRGLPGVARSLHPTHSIAARGQGAEELVAGHAEAATPFGEGTPFARLIERGMQQVWFGIGLRIFTLYHAFECLYPGGFPIDVFLERPMSARCIDEHGHELTVATLVHDPAVGRRKNPTRDELRRLLEQSGVLRRTTLGRGEILAARMPELMDELGRLLRERGLTIYDIELAPAGETA